MKAARCFIRRQEHRADPHEARTRSYRGFLVPVFELKHSGYRVFKLGRFVRVPLWMGEAIALRRGES
jgi:hypothetical protein